MVNLLRNRKTASGDALQLTLNVMNARSVQQQQQQQQQARAPGSTSEGAGVGAGGGSSREADLSPAELSELCEVFARRVAVDPFDPTRFASLLSIAVLPSAVAREFLALLAWCGAGKGRAGARPHSHARTQLPASTTEAAAEQQRRQEHEAAMATASGVGGDAAGEAGDMRGSRCDVALCLEDRVCHGWAVHESVSVGASQSRPPVVAAGSRKNMDEFLHSNVVVRRLDRDNTRGCTLEFTLLFTVNKQDMQDGRMDSAWIPYTAAVRIRVLLTSARGNAAPVGSGTNSLQGLVPLRLQVMWVFGSHGNRCCWETRSAWDTCRSQIVQAVARFAGDGAAVAGSNKEEGVDDGGKPRTPLHEPGWLVALAKSVHDAITRVLDDPTHV